MISFLTVALAVMAPTGLNAQDNSKIEQNTQGVVAEAGPYSLIMNPDAREGYSLDGTWNNLVDPYETGYYSYRMTPNNDAATFFADKSFNSDKTDLVEYDFDTAPTLRVPGDWNTQNDKLYYYEGTVWYRRKFNHRTIPGQRIFLYFEGANYETIVGLNGRKVGKHVGGFTPFDFEVTDRILDGENSIVVKVDNRRKAEGVPTINADWWNYGGLTRSVKLLRVPETFIRDYEVQLAAEQETGTGACRRGQRRLSFRVQLDGSRPEQNVCLSIPELNFSKLDRIPGLCGCTPWVLKDFRSPKRMLTGIQDDYNRKGLVSDQGQKKNAFGVVQKWYSEK